MTKQVTLHFISHFQKGSLKVVLQTDGKQFQGQGNKKLQKINYISKDKYRGLYINLFCMVNYTSSFFYSLKQV